MSSSMHRQPLVVPVPSLVTSQIVYHLPDRRDLLQEFIWQGIDSVPDIPNLRKLLRHWVDTLDGPIHHVTVAYRGLVSSADMDAFRQGKIVLQ